MYDSEWRSCVNLLSAMGRPRLAHPVQCLYAGPLRKHGSRAGHEDGRCRDGPLGPEPRGCTAKRCVRGQLVLPCTIWRPAGLCALLASRGLGAATTLRCQALVTQGQKHCCTVQGPAPPRLLHQHRHDSAAAWPIGTTGLYATSGVLFRSAEGTLQQQQQHTLGPSRRRGWLVTGWSPGLSDALQASRAEPHLLQRSWC